MGRDRGCWPLAAMLGLAVVLFAGAEAADPPRPGDDATYRPTVMVRRDRSLGTGTIIASVEGETLILTAWHVVAEPGPVFVELNRYNLGLERFKTVSGFPRKLEASVVAREVDADLAILRVRKQLALPYVARIVAEEMPPPKGMKVTTIGFDKGERLIGFSTRVRAIERIDLEHGGGFRSFLVTEDPPEIGRSGGGLFRADGALVGVCIARAELPEGKTLGLFSSAANVRDLIRSNEDVRASMARAKSRARSAGR